MTCCIGLLVFVQFIGLDLQTLIPSASLSWAWLKSNKRTLLINITLVRQKGVKAWGLDVRIRHRDQQVT